MPPKPSARARPALKALVLALSGLACTAAAQSNISEDDLALAYGDKATISIATGHAQALNRAPAVATVITAEDIAAMGATDLDEVLETVPGLHVSRSSVRYAATYLIRGIGGGNQSNPQVLLLQNGVPTTTMFNGDKGSAWRGTAVENIARIEVIRGPGSALYGADAYAGVINIVTKTANATPGTELGLRAGSFGTRDAWVQHGGKAGAADIAAYLRVGGTDGLRETVAADAQTRNDRLFGTRASLAPGPVNAGYDAVDGSLTASYGNWRANGAYKLRDRLGTGAGVSSALVAGSLGRAEVFTGDLGWSDLNFGENWGLGFNLSHLQYNFTYPENLMLLPPGTRLASGSFPDGLIGGPNQWERQTRLSAFANYAGFAGHALRIGLGHDDLDLYRTRTMKNYLLNAAGAPVPAGPVIDYSDIQPFIRPQRRKINYLYAQDEWSLARDWTLTAGLRHDSYSDFGGTTNPRLALVWEAAHDLTAKILYGTAFRAPAFNEQYGINPVSNGNPGLKPETVRTLEAALAWRLRPEAHVSLSVFRYAMQNLIRIVANPAPAPGATFQNTGEQNGYGAELEGTWDMARNLRLSGHYAYQHSTDETTGRDAGYTPRHHLYARADWRFGNGWLLGGQANRIAGRRRGPGDARPPVPDYTTVDVTVRGQADRKGWSIAASVRNLFDATVLEPSLAPGLLLPDDLPMAPRTFWLQLGHRL